MALCSVQSWLTKIKQLQQKKIGVFCFNF